MEHQPVFYVVLYGQMELYYDLQGVAIPEFS